MRRLLTAVVAIFFLLSLFGGSIPAGTVHPEGHTPKVCSLMGDDCPHHHIDRAGSTEHPALYCDCGSHDEAAGSLTVPSAINEGYCLLIAPSSEQPLGEGAVAFESLTKSPPEDPPRAV